MSDIFLKVFNMSITGKLACVGNCDTQIYVEKGAQVDDLSSVGRRCAAACHAAVF